MRWGHRGPRERSCLIAAWQARTAIQRGAEPRANRHKRGKDQRVNIVDSFLRTFVRNLAVWRWSISLRDFMVVGRRTSGARRLAARSAAGFARKRVSWIKPRISASIRSPAVRIGIRLEVPGFHGLQYRAAQRRAPSGDLGCGTGRATVLSSSSSKGRPRRYSPARHRCRGRERSSARTMSSSRGSPLGNAWPDEHVGQERRPNSYHRLPSLREPTRENTPLLDRPMRSAAAAE